MSVFDPTTLLTVGAFGATLSSLWVARAQARFALALLPCALGLSVFAWPALLDVWGLSASVGGLSLEPLSVTLKLDLVGEGLKVRSAPLHLAHGLSAWLAPLAALTGGVALLAHLAKRALTARLALGAWATLVGVWLLSAPISALQWFKPQRGEFAVRAWLNSGEHLSPLIDLNRLVAFVPPEGEWLWRPASLSVALLGFTCALMGASLPSDSAPQRELTGGAWALYQVSALLAVVGLMWQLISAQGFVGVVASWVVVVSLSVGAQLSRSAAQSALLAVLALSAVAL